MSNHNEGSNMFGIAPEEIDDALEEVLRVDERVTITKGKWFTVRELTCEGTGECKMNARFVRRCDWLRAFLGESMPVTSGYRAPAYNAQVSSTGLTGPHTTGHAIDVQCSGAKAQRLIALALALGFTGIGVSQKGPHGTRFIHLDDLRHGPNCPRPWVWSY